jgi:hypothetical protein
MSDQSPPVITIDIVADGSSFIGAHKLTPATRFVQKAALTALAGLGLALNSTVTFRRQGRTVRTCRLDFGLRGDKAITS